MWGNRSRGGGEERICGGILDEDKKVDSGRKDEKGEGKIARERKKVAVEGRG
jgi:hypothetical protein